MPHAKRQTPSARVPLAAKLPHAGFGRRIVGFGEPGFGITAGPALRLEAAREEVLTGTNCPNRVARIARPPDIVPLLTDDHAVAAAVHPSRRATAQNVHNAPSCHLPKRFDTCRL